MTSAGARWGFTLIETVFAVALFAIVFSVLWTFYAQSRRGEEDLTGSFAAQQDLMIAMARLTREVQEGVTLFYPRPEDGTQSGLGFVNAQGRAIMYYLEKPAAPTPATSAPAGILVRVDLIANTRSTVAQNVSSFRAKVQLPAPGKKVCLSNVNLSILRGRKDDPGKLDDFSLVTKVFLRNLKAPLPD